MGDLPRMTFDLWKQINKIERKIEATMRKQPAPSYIENMFGSYDRADLTAEILRLYRDLQHATPDDVDVKYRHAGALMRASSFDEAKALYKQILSSNTSAHLMLAMLQLKCGDTVSAEARLSIYNQRCVAEGMSVMQSSIEKISLQRQGTP